MATQASKSRTPKSAAVGRRAAIQAPPAEPHYCQSSGNRQVVLVLQGGGALGAYQVGVYQALHEAGIEPDW